MKRRIILIILLVFTLVVLIGHGIKLQIEDGYSNRQKEVVFIQNDTNNEIAEVQIVNLNDCKEGIVDYDSDRQTILYINTDNQIVEKFVDTGKTQLVDVNGIKTYLSMETNKQIHNLQYSHQMNHISFTYAGELYVYNLQTRELVKLIECCTAYGRNTYEWINQEDVYVRGFSEVDLELFEYNLLEQEKVSLCCGPISFTLDGENGKIYAIIVQPKSHAFGFELKQKLAKIDTVDGNLEELLSIDTENYILESDKNYLYYVEQRAELWKYKLYRINLESGKKECVYKTDKIIVDIIVK